MLRKWLEFFQSSKEEKYIKISRVLYSALHKKEFAALGRHSLIIKPVIILNRKYMHIGRDVSIWNGARIECISTWNGKNITPPPPCT